MHVSSMDNMERCYRRFIAGGDLEASDRVTVLDLGGADVNGSYRDLFRDKRYDYLGADIAPGEGVAVVLENPYKIPLPDASMDIVLSGQMLEHCEFFWQSFAEMVRVLKPSGFLFLIAPSAGPIHRYPVDCYRFYPDAYAALARYAGCELVDVWREERGPWNDLVGVFRHKDAAPLSVRPLAPLEQEPPAPAAPASAAEEAAKGSVSVLDVLKELHAALQPERYFEIGARDGAALSLARCPALVVGPHAGGLGPLPANVEAVAAASVDFFFRRKAEEIMPQAPDLVFLDGARYFERVLEDFMQVERMAGPSTLVAVSHVLPNHPAQASRRRSTQLWAGDVWKLHEALRAHRPDLVLTLLDASPTGLLLIGALDRMNSSLWTGYGWLADQYGQDREVPPDVLSRRHAVNPSPEFLQALGASLRMERGEKPRLVNVRRKLRQLVA